VLQWVLVAGIGLTAGFSARYFLANSTYTLRLVTVFLSLLAGLIFLGLISRGLLGTRLPASDQQSLNLGWLSQFVLAAVAAWLSLSAWKISTRPAARRGGRSGTRPTSTSAAPQASIPASRPKTSSGSTRPARSPAGKLPPITRPEFWQDRLQKARVRLRRWWEQGLPDALEPPAQASKRPSVRLQARHTRRSASQRSSAARRPSASPVRLIGKEEHRCPYCLEDVLENDPRGVRICPICHTHHHADCWDVTGTCQVPHYHE
jgi:hypothetical protein